MADLVKEILAKPIQLGDQLIKAANNGLSSFKQDCLEIKSKTEKLMGLLRQAARASNELYERPLRRIMDDTTQVLDKALTLVLKCRANGLKRVFTIIPAAAFRKTSQQLENSIGDMSWLLRVSMPADDREDDYLGGLPPIAADEPTLCLVWEQIASLCSGSITERSDAAGSLVSMAKQGDYYKKSIIDEGGVVPLLKLAKEGGMEGQENAVRAIGLLSINDGRVEHIVNAGVCTVFAKILKEGHMKVQLAVAWSISELAHHYPPCQDHFAQNHTIRLLVSHLAFETIQEHSKYVIASKQTMSIHTVVLASSSSTNNNSNKNNDEDDKQLLTDNKISHPLGNTVPNQMQNVVTNTIAMKSTGFPPQKQAQHQSDDAKTHHNNAKETLHHYQQSQQQQQQRAVFAGSSIKGREFEDPATKAEMKAMAAKALWKLCIENVQICREITESRALLCFAVLLDKGPEEVQEYSAMALMEITAVAAQNAELRRSSFKPTSPAARAVVDQLLKIIEKEDSQLLLPAIKSMGHLARTFRATETRIIGPLVRLLDERETDMTFEVAFALIKFANTENFLHVYHSKAIIDAGGAKHLVQLVYFGEPNVQIASLELLCYISMHVPDSEVLAQAEVLIVLEWATKQGSLAQVETVAPLLEEAKKRLELYQSRSSRGRL